MATPLIITKSDFVGRVELPNNLGNEKINQHILHSEDFDLCKLMGDRFYYYFMSNFEANGTIKVAAPQAIKDLYDGVEYTVEDITYSSPGIKPVLVYFAAARLIKKIGSHITPNSYSTKVNEFSEPVSNSTRVFDSNEYENEAIAYWNKNLLYMSNNRGLFPYFYENDCGCGNGRTNGKRPTMIPVGGRSITPCNGYDRRFRNG